MQPPERRHRLDRERFHTREIASLKVELTIEGESMECVTGNISQSGMLIETDREVPVGTTITVNIEYKEYRATGEAAIASRVAEGLGVMFIQPTPEFRDAVEKIIICLRDERRQLTSSDTHDSVSARAAWSYPTEGSSLKRLLTRRHHANLFSLTSNGAALVSKRSPQVGETIVVYLDDTDDGLQCNAEVVRHTDRGFAVKFMEPCPRFTARVAELRQR